MLNKKQCYACKMWLDATLEFFHKTSANHDGLNTYCKECSREKVYKWREDNPDKWKESYTKSDSRDDYNEEKRYYNRLAREKGVTLEWQRKNKDKIKGYREKRMNKTHSFTKKQWESCKSYFNNECAYCGLHISEHFNMYAGKLKWTDFHKEHVDHNGSNGIDNCVPSCKTCNSEKHTSKLEEWYVGGRRGYSEERKNKILKWLVQDHVGIAK